VNLLIDLMNGTATLPRPARLLLVGGLFGLMTSSLVPAASASAATAAPTVQYGIVGQGGLGDALDPTLQAQQYNSGVRGRLVELGWNVLQPTGPSDWNADVAAVFQQRIDAFVSTGPDTQLYLDLGLSYPPSWVSSVDPLTDQFGNTWSGSASNGGGVNVYFSPRVRQMVAGYVQKVFTNLNFRNRLAIVRVGFYNAELVFPAVGSAASAPVSFWAFDATAQAQSPVPGWKPGQASPAGEAKRFYLWYVDSLTDSFKFVLSEIRKQYSGKVAPVTPGGGQWDETVTNLIAHNLYIPTWAHVGTGNYWQRIYSMLPSASDNVVNWVSSVSDGSGVNEAGTAPWEWSSTHQHAYLAHLNGRQIFSENNGSNSYDATKGADTHSTMQWAVAAAHTYQLDGLMWVRQSTMSAPQNASLAHFAIEIALHP
jgi:hypothetical protein